MEFTGDSDEYAILNPICSRIQQGAIKSLYKYISTPGFISLGGGLPNDSVFPFERMTVELTDGSTLFLEKQDFQKAKNGESQNNRTSALSLNYGLGKGHPNVYNWMKEHVQSVHSPPCTSWDVCHTVGGTDSIFKCLFILNIGTTLLTEEYTYPVTMDICKILGISTVGVRCDEFGIVPDALRQTCVDLANKNSPAKALYTIPTGQNPTGTSMSMERKSEVYDIAREFHLTIIEDDAYYYIQFPSSDCSDKLMEDFNEDEMPGLSLAASFLSLDVDGRVVRMDTTTKFICPGLRLGWVTGPDSFIKKYSLLNDNTCLMSSGFSQSIFSALMSHWGVEGFNNHLKRLQLYYVQQRAAALKAATEHLSELATWSIPQGGMFLWIKISGFEDTESMLEDLIEAKILMVPGKHFSSTGNSTSYLRATYATAAPEKLDEAFRRLAAVLISKGGKSAEKQKPSSNILMPS